MKRLFYLPLEPVASRYTRQLTTWMIDAFDRVGKLCRGDKEVTVITVTPEKTKGIPDDIVTGKVLDATGRALWSLRQCEVLLKAIEDGTFQDGDSIYLQDFWTPGIEGVLYSLEVHGISARISAMVHAQSVDQFDFTYPMRGWMRHSEKALCAYMAKNKGRLFCASTCHKEQMESCWKNNHSGVPKIHVVGLPFNMFDVKKTYKDYMGSTMTLRQTNAVAFASRMHAEKNPEFMHKVAINWCLAGGEVNPSVWTVCTSAQKFPEPYTKYGATGYVEDVGTNYRFKHGLSKQDYYKILAESKIIFNCSDQDYISWTLLEGITLGCIPVVPNYRSFPELFNYIGDTSYMYTHLDLKKALEGLDYARLTKGQPEILMEIPLMCSKGRLLAAWLAMSDNHDIEVNIWKGDGYLADLLFESVGQTQP